MSTQSLKELVDAIKAQGKSLASGDTQTADAANARDLVYLSTAVERLYGADALLALTDAAARPAENITVASPGTGAISLTDDQCTKDVVTFKADTGTYTASEVEVTVPNKGFAFVISNELTIPVRVATATQASMTPAYIEVAAGKHEWLFCEGTKVARVIDAEAIAAAATSPVTTDGDIYYRAEGDNDRLPVGNNSDLLTVQDGMPVWKRTGFRPHTRVKAMSDNYMGKNPDGSLNYGGTYTEADGTEAATPTTISTVATNRLGNYITDATTFPHAANVGTWDIDQEPTDCPDGSGCLTEDGGFMMWGISTSGRTGSISGRNRTPFRPALYNSTTGGIELADVTDFKIKQLICGNTFTYVLTDEGDVYSTGYNAQGQLGDGSTSARSYFKKMNFSGSAGPVRYIMIGKNQGSDAECGIYALMEDGDVYSWGDNGSGQLGHGDTTNRLQPTKIATFDQNVRCVVARGMHVAFITNDNVLYMCGENARGQCGNGTTTDVTTPTEIDIGGPVVKVALAGRSSSGFTHALRADGRLYGWGENQYGQVGDNSTTDRSTPTLCNNIGLSVGLEVIDVWNGGADWGVTHALTKNGNVYSWGHNTVGSLGVGDFTNKGAPTLNSNITWPSSIQQMGCTTSSSYIYHATSFMSHATLQDRIDRKNGVVETCGYQGTHLGRPYSGNQNVPKPVGIAPPQQGRMQFHSTQGFHTSSTQAMFCMSLDEDGILHMWGHAGSYSSGQVMTSADTSPWQPNIL